MRLSDKAKSLVFLKYQGTGYEQRFEHIQGVVKMASYLAEQYHIDVEKAKTAAYFHDYYKYESNEELSTLILEKDQEECRQFPVLYHSYASAEAYKRLLGEDEEIYQAIRNHVFGRIGMSKLEEIILIADYTEEHRTYPSCIACREILLSGQMDQAIYQSTAYVIEFLEKRNIKPHPLQYEIKKLYEQKRRIK